MSEHLLLAVGHSNATRPLSASSGPFGCLATLVEDIADRLGLSLIRPPRCSPRDRHLTSTVVPGTGPP